MERKLYFVLGQQVVVKIEKGSNAARYIKMNLDNINDWCFDGIVTRITKKYITVAFEGGYEKEYKFNIEDDYRNKYSTGGANYKLYLSKEQVIEEFKTDELYSKIKDYFYNNKRLTLNQLERIDYIMKERVGICVTPEE